MFIVRTEMPDIADLLKEITELELKEATKATAEAMKAKMNEPKSGRIYGSHRASAPGQAPAEKSGKLIGSIMPSAEGLRGSIGLYEYGAYLDEGWGRIAARPFVVPSLDEALAQG